MRALAALIICILVSLPSIFAGLPMAAPFWFAQTWFGIPASVVFMSGLLLAFVGFAAICSALSKGQRLAGGK